MKFLGLFGFGKPKKVKRQHVRHQGFNERFRRVRQIARGQLAMSGVSDVRARLREEQERQAA